MGDARKAVYCTLLMNDRYLPGAMVLAHSLRDNGTKAKLVALVTLDGLQTSTVEELKTIYDEITPINRIKNSSPANLYLMDRSDLISTFSKIELWKQIQYKQIVYIDADIVAVRAPDELLEMDTHFAAAPDIGWPDCFNTGVLVLRPNLQDYYSLLAFAQRGISFDGADQGLLNMHFKDWTRLSFTYNCTPSGNYQYIPAFRHFQSTISLIHYIGPKKPWNFARQTHPVEEPYNQLLAQWWAVYDRHYRPKPPLTTIRQPDPSLTAIEPPLSQHAEREILTPSKASADGGRRLSVSGRGVNLGNAGGVPKTAATLIGSEYVPEIAVPQSTGSVPTSHTKHVEAPSVAEPGAQDRISRQSHSIESEDRAVASNAAPKYAGTEEHRTTYHDTIQPRSLEPVEISAIEPKNSHPQTSESPARALSVVPKYVHGEEYVITYRDSDRPLPREHTEASAIEPILGAGILEPPFTHADASLELEKSQPQNSPKELVSLVAPEERAPSPPIAVWDASRAPPPLDSKPEASTLPSHTYKMSESTQLFQPPTSYPEAPKNMYYDVPPRLLEKPTHVFPWENQAPSASRVFLDESQDPEHPCVSDLPPPPTNHRWPEPPRASPQRGVDKPHSTWESYERASAWDEVPEIERYIQALRKPRTAKVQVISGSNRGGGPPGLPGSSQKGSSIKLTDFPTEADRPSLPVTPAPIRRGTILTGDDEEAGNLPVAQGVPQPEEWNPMERLEELRRLNRKLLEEPLEMSSQDVPKRQMPGVD